eukprot:TRINITY_DN19261_c0_g1_i1.p1 TRINITY_DN19261_c0_g1~~TRINITY_DN19261_c0_g1_i1.p1  ORF type:complete len:205 (+),score=44.68 TRINITY_DN19261_c0_g1_i1:136-750(+)
MPLFETLNHIYKHAWADISMASWRKYPNPQRPDVLSVDLLSRDLDPTTGVLTTKRLICCKGQGPTWAQKLMGASHCFFVEEATIDPKSQKMVLTSRNLSFSDLILMEEVCTYTPHLDNVKWTQFKQEAKVTAFPFGIKGKLECFLLEKFKSNATKGREIMEQAIARVKQESQRVEDLADEAFANLDRAVSEALPVPASLPLLSS